MADRFDALRDDVRYTIRSLVRQPVFALVVIATLTLGIARDDRDLSCGRSHRAASASLSESRPHRLPRLEMDAGLAAPARYRHGSSRSGSSRVASSTVWRRRALSNRRWETTIQGRRRAGYAHHRRLSRRHRMQPTLGRGFSKDEFRSDAPPVAILSRRAVDGPVRRRSERESVTRFD